MRRNNTQYPPRRKKHKVDHSNFQADEPLIIRAQAHIRGYLAHRDYHIPQLDQDDLFDSQVYLVGNDPEMTDLSAHRYPGEKIAVIGTSGLRSIEIACELGDAAMTPKLIIIDNSRQVMEFWRALRDFAQGYQGMERYFIRQFRTFLRTMRDNIRHACEHSEHDIRLMNTDTITYLNQDPDEYMSGLIDKHGFEYVLAVLRHTTVIGQDWQNKELLVKLKNIITLHGIERIVMYPSNIASMLDDDSRKMLKNIEMFDPSLTIHTDYCTSHQLPHHVFFCKNNQAKKVAATLCGEKETPTQDDDSVLTHKQTHKRQKR